MYREILTKAIIAKGEKTIQEERVVDVNAIVSKALGCWIINHVHSIKRENQKIFIEGSYDAYFWYGYNQDTACGLYNEKFTYSYEVPYTYTQETVELNQLSEIKETVVKKPTCISMNFDHSTMTIQVEFKFSIDIIGETKLKIKVDDVIIDQMINTDYVKDNK